MNKYKINPMLIHIKEKEQTVRENYVVPLCMQNAHPHFDWNRLFSYRQIFLEKSDKNNAGKCRLLLSSLSILSFLSVLIDVPSYFRLSEETVTTTKHTLTILNY